MKAPAGVSILLTGATSGIGRETARALARAGARVLVHGRDAEKVEHLRAELSGTGAEIGTVLADLSSLAETARLGRDVIRLRPSLEVLINNAGIGFGHDANRREVSADGHELRFAVNYLAPFLLTETLLAAGLLRRAVINVASVGQEPIDFDDLMTLRGYTGRRMREDGCAARPSGSFRITFPDNRRLWVLNIPFMDSTSGRIDTCTMRATGILPFLAILLALSVPAWADPPGRVGRISYVEGAVAFASNGSEKWETASLNYPVTSGDRISTAEGGRAEVHVGSTAIRVAQDSGISFTALDDQSIQIRLDRGTMSVRLRRVEPDTQFEIDTETSSISLDNPVSLRVDQTANGDATIRARGGTVDVTTGQSSFTVDAGQTAGIPAADPAAYWLNTASSNDGWDQWVASRDATEDNVVSARYVSREMDGVEDLDDYGTWETFPGYGPCWVPRIPSGVWAPYTFGRWAWVAPWGWTWIDVEPWGFAPFHYGRWAQVSGIWVWSPGAIVRHPVYAPALVTWVGGKPGPGLPPDGSHIAWAPLRPREPFHPLYEASPAHIRAINGVPVPVVARRQLYGARRPAPFVPRTDGYIPRDGRGAPVGRFTPGGPVPREWPYPHPRDRYRPAPPPQVPPQEVSGPRGPQFPQFPQGVRGAPPQRGGPADNQDLWRSRGGGRSP